MGRLLLVATLLAGVACGQEASLVVAPDVMAGHCLTTVSPQNRDTQVLSAVVVRVLISASGKVAPVRTVSGPPALEAEAMNAVRLWKYRPFVRNNQPVDVMTDVRVVFEPGKPGGMVSHPNH